MARKKKEPKKESAANSTGGESAYDMATPLWSRYYHEVRKRLRFPRHYKKAVNW
jgi:hypothetical protein